LSQRLGSVVEVEKEAGPITHGSIRKLDRRLSALEDRLNIVTKNNQLLISHADLGDLAYDDAGHTGFASTVALTTGLATKASTATQAIAGAGLTGTGTLAADFTFAVGAGTGISVAADAVAVDQSFSPTWTGSHIFSNETVHNGGVDVGTSGRLDSNVADSGTNVGFLIKPTTAFTSGRFIFSLQDSAGNVLMQGHYNDVVEFGGSVGAGIDTIMAVSAATAKNAGIFFAPTSFTGAGQSIFPSTGVGGTGTIAGAYFNAIPSTSGTSTKTVGGAFSASVPSGRTVNSDDNWGAWFQPLNVVGTGSGTNSARTFARTGGWRVLGIASIAKNAGTYTNLYGGYIENLVTGTVSASGSSLANTYGLYIEKQDKGVTSNFSLKSLGIIDCDEEVQARQVRADGDVSGVASNNTLTGATDTPTTDPGWATSDTVAMNVPDGYIKMYVGTQAVVIPYWNT
jgi:hypothetical protein